MSNIGYEFRWDGLYYVRSRCLSCSEDYDCLAVAPASTICPACATVRAWEREYREWLNAVPTFWPYMGKDGSK